LKPNSQSTQKKAKEVTHNRTTHNQNKNRNNANAKNKQAQAARHTLENTAPFTTTNKHKTTHLEGAFDHSKRI